MDNPRLRSASSGLRRSARISSTVYADMQATRAQVASQNAIARMRRGSSMNTAKKPILLKHKAAVNNKTATKEDIAVGKKLKMAPEKVLACPICFLEFNVGDVNISATLCGHVFCTECILKAMNIHKRCPLCCMEGDSADIRRIYLPFLSE